MAQPASASGAAGSTASVECSLYGLVGDGALAVLLDRLVALCGDVRRGVLGSPDFEEHEAVFVPAAPAQREEGARLEDTMLRLRSSVIDSRTHERVLDFNAREWRMSSYGNPDPRNPACVVRAVASAAVKGRVFELVAALGFKYMFDFTRRGYAFTWDYVIRVTVTQTYRVRFRGLGSLRTRA
ncbi:hypothetical protein DFJ74DRAFT_668401 [Hyaloraphidium curvatum]|nr:hypothetical protein DFJ74DRAFT_668401 [Hyaloraphidium curvatum]